MISGFARKSAMDLNTNIRVNFAGGGNYTITVANTGRQLRNRNYPESGAGWKIIFGSTKQFFFNELGSSDKTEAVTVEEK